MKIKFQFIRDEEKEKKEFSDDANSNDKEEVKKQLLITLPQISLHKEDGNKSVTYFISQTISHQTAAKIRFASRTRQEVDLLRENISS